MTILESSKSNIFEYDNQVFKIKEEVKFPNFQKKQPFVGGGTSVGLDLTMNGRLKVIYKFLR